MLYIILSIIIILILIAAATVIIRAAFKLRHIKAKMADDRMEVCQQAERMGNE